ncbi:MAG: DUF3795 domain-containing protein [Methanoregula sp.]
MTHKEEGTLKDFNFDTYCGLYCGACSIMMACRTGRKDALASFWTEPILRSSLQSRGIDPPDSESLQLKCHGCKTGTLFVNCRHCKIRSCAIEKKIEHCNECNEYPCGFFDESLLNADIQKMVPHVKNAPDNLEKIRKDGVEQWLNEQKKRWECPGCGTSYSWYTTSCPQCGKDHLDTWVFQDPRKR